MFTNNATIIQQGNSSKITLNNLKLTLLMKIARTSRGDIKRI